MVDIAQLVSASDCGSEGRGFESHYPPQKKERIPYGILSFLFVDLGFEPSKRNSPVDCCWPGRAPATPYDSFQRKESVPNPIIHPITVKHHLCSNNVFFVSGVDNGIRTHDLQSHNLTR